MRQTTLRKYRVRGDSSPGSDDEEDQSAAPDLKKSEIFYWTKVQNHEDMRKQTQPAY